MSMNELGPNMKSLVIYRISIAAVPDGGGIEDALRFLTERDHRTKITNDAIDWVKQAIWVVRKADEPNPWRASTDEEIAGELLRRLV